MSKLKNKYSSPNSLSEVGKKRPNEILFFLILLCSFEAFAQRDSITVYFLGYNKKRESYRVYNDDRLVLDVKTSDSFMYSFKIPRDPSLKSDMVGFRSIKVYKRKLLGYRVIGPVTVYQNKKYFVIRRSPLLRRKFSIEFFWTDDEPRNPYWHP